MAKFLLGNEPSLHFQAHLQFTQANALPKIAKEPSNPSHKDRRRMK
jgi:hypothetical protein